MLVLIKKVGGSDCNRSHLAPFGVYRMGDYWAQRMVHSALGDGRSGRGRQSSIRALIA